MTTATAPAKPSLRSRITRHALLALVLVWGLGSAVVLTVGNHFAGEAFDRALLDDAYALAAHVRATDAGALRLDLTPREASLLRFDQKEAVLFTVFDAAGGYLGGDQGLLPGPAPSGADHVFTSLTLGGHNFRRVRLRPGGDTPFTVVMAQTIESRTQLQRQLMLYSALAQLWLLVVLASWLVRGIGSELQPLAALQDAVAQRDAGDLRPLPEALAQQAHAQDVQRLGEAVNALLARLEHSLRAQREFAGNVAHELRTPLAGMRMQAAQALAQDDPAVWRAELQNIAAAEQRASRTVDQLLALARADEGAAVLVLEPLALDALVREVVLRFLPRADALGVDLGAEGLDADVVVRGNAGLVEGIVNNLVDNALRYATGPTPHVTVGLWCDDAVDGPAREVLLGVTDNGPGLDAAMAEALQHRWAQGEQGVRMGAGAGLGLAIVSRHAALLGGRLVLAPGPGGRGLCAGVRLPLVSRHIPLA